MGDQSTAIEVSGGKRRGELVLDPETRERIFSNPNVVNIPAGEGRQGAQILKQPAFWAVDHGVVLVDYTADGVPVDKRHEHAVFYASFLFRTGDDVRMVTLPVDLFREPAYQQYLLELIGRQGGLPVDKAKRDCSHEAVSELFGDLDLKPLRDLIYTLHDPNPGALVVEGYNPRYGSEMVSGWGAGDKSLTVVGRERTDSRSRYNLYAYIQGRLETGIRQISEPLQPVERDPGVIGVLSTILKANGIEV